MEPLKTQILKKMGRILFYLKSMNMFFYHMIDEVEAKETEKFQFPLCCLPALAANEVVKSLDIPERIKLAITSRRMENFVKRGSSKTPLTYNFYIYNENSQILIEHKEEIVAIVGKTILNADQDLCIETEQLVPWLNWKRSNLWNMTCVLRKLRRIIPTGKFELSLNTDKISVEFLKKLIAIPEFSTIQMMKVGKQIESEILKIVMDWCPRNVKFAVCTDSVVSTDFHHEKAFKFSTVIYDDARWVKVQDLFTLENSDEVRLCDNTLTSNDVNRFLEFWIESDLDMFREYSMWADSLDITEVLGDIIRVETTRDGHDYLMIKSTRKLKIMSIIITAEACLKLHVYPQEEEAFSKEYKVLELMEQKKRLETELQGGEAQRLTMEIRELKKKLNEICTFFDDKTAIIA
ncbi:unnamed protein product [Caenorhabditis brenneri]